MNKIISVCWDVTSKCNDSCKFCFRDTGSKDLSIENNILILNKLIKYGITKITFTGGEASLYDGLWELVSYAKSANIYTNLVTNAIKIDDIFFKHIEKHLDCLTMSLDAPNQVIQERMTRNKNHFDNVLSILKKIDDNHVKIEKKINTLVTKVNIEYVIDILPILYDYKIEIWKLFQFISPRYMAELNSDLFSISEYDFNRLKSNISENNNKIKTIFQSAEDLKKTYFVISSNGNVRYDADDKAKIIGNLLEDNMDSIINRMDFDYKQYSYRINTYQHSLIASVV